MPVVISNTSVLQYLHQIDALFLLPELFGSLYIPHAVVEELAAGIEGGVYLPDIEVLSWIEVLYVQHPELLPLVTHLGKGEKEVLALGLEKPGSLLLLDDKSARRHGSLLSLKIIGTLGVLLLGKEQDKIDAVSPFLDRLDALGFRLHPSTRQSVLRLASELG